MQVLEHALKDDDGKHLAYVTPASDHDVKLVLASDPTSEDGRSNWVWVRLSSGELILGVFPQGDVYEEVSQAHAI